MAPKKSPKAFAKSESKKRKVEQEVEEEPEVDQEEGMESVTGSARKSLTDNILNQMRFATMKLEKVDSGEIKVSDAEHQELQGKVQFLSDWKALSRADPQKLEMLASFENDKTCKNWATFKKKYSLSSETESSSIWGYGTEQLICNFVHFT